MGTGHYASYPPPPPTPHRPTALPISRHDAGADTFADPQGPHESNARTRHSSSDTQTGVAPSLWQNVRRDVVLLGAGSMAIVIAQLGFRGILVLALAPTAYGRLTLVLSVYNTVFLIGASGLPNSVARYIALSTGEHDSAIVRSAIWAGAGPTAIAAIIVATVSALLLRSPLAFLFAAIGLSSLIYSLISTGVLRGRGRIVLAASILPIAAVGEVAPLAILWLSGVGLTPLSAFAAFCFGNLIGLIAGVICTVRTSPRAVDVPTISGLGSAPSPRQLLGFSVWLGAAAVAIAILPLIMRAIAVIDSYVVVAAVDIALVLLSIPQRLGALIVQASIPHATRALRTGDIGLTISRREHVVLIVPFVLVAALLAFTPAVAWLFTAIGRPGYAKSAPYLALALLAAPPRILYGLVEGVLAANGEGRFLASNAWLIMIAAGALMLIAAMLGSVEMAFAVFVAACWAIYIYGLRRIRRLSPSVQTAYSMTTPVSASTPQLDSI